MARPHGSYLLRNGKPTNYFAPNFEPPYTTKMTRSLLSNVMRKSWDSKRSDWSSEQPVARVTTSLLLSTMCGCADSNNGGSIAREATTAISPYSIWSRAFLVVWKIVAMATATAVSLVAVLEIIMATAAINSTRATCQAGRIIVHLILMVMVVLVVLVAIQQRAIQPQLHQNAHDHSQKLYDQRIVLAMFYYRIES